MGSELPRPPIDPELAIALEKSRAARPIPDVITREIILALHANPSLFPGPTLEDAVGNFPISHRERRVPGHLQEDPEVTLSIFKPEKEAKDSRPCVYHIHGGGMVAGNRFGGLKTIFGWVAETDAVVVSVEYRLAPENPHPALVNDCYAGLYWVSKHAQELGVDAERIMIAGVSGGGGLAAAVALMSRDLKGPKLCAQFLACPMLDDRNNTVSSQQYLEGPWSRGSNIMAWNAVLDMKAGAPGVSIYASPTRAEDLSGLPCTFIDVGSAEDFRDECVAYASRLWAAGVQADLHVYGGGFHGFHSTAPQSRLAIISSQVQNQWVKKALAAKLERVEVPTSRM